MSEMVERAARAARHVLLEGKMDDAALTPLDLKISTAALLAALDFSEDRAGFNLLRTAIAVADDGHPDGLKYREQTKAAIRALHDLVRPPQAEPGE